MNSLEKKPKVHSYDLKIFNRRSAEIIVPILFEKFIINSVVDIGCGPATWLAVFRDKGIVDYLGIDSEHIDVDKLEIDRKHFKTENLEQFIPPARKFDICISLEVAEHLSESVADSFIENLTSLSDIVLFSSAIPGQTGQHHVNLQWPTYWAEKFEQRGYRCSDFIRPLIWENENVEWWYKQNILLFLNDKIDFNESIGNPAIRIHPQQYKKVLGRLNDYQQADKRSLWKKVKDRFI